MKVLVVNCGSSSLKYQVLDMTGEVVLAKGLIERIGLKGSVIKHEKEGFDKVVKEIGPHNLILETDSPYLAPVPHRGKRNESSYICIINKKLAEIFGMSEEETASITYANSTRLFNL